MLHRRSRHVIYTVGPVYSGTAKVQLVCDQLASCYTRSLHVAAHHSLTQIVRSSHDRC